MKYTHKAEIFDAITSGHIRKIDQGNYPGAHSEPYLFTAKDGSDYVLLRAREKRFIDGYIKQQVLYPFLARQNLPVRTARELELVECGGETYAVLERFHGRGHYPARFASASKEQQSRFVKQIAVFFHELHSIPVSSLPTGIDYTPYFAYEKDASDGEEVFLHADFNYSNFVTDDDYNLHAVFDWHPACIGPRCAEFAAFVYCRDVDLLPLVLKEYNNLASTNITAKRVLLHYEARSKALT